MNVLHIIPELPTEQDPNLYVRILGRVLYSIGGACVVALVTLTVEAFTG